MQDFYMQPPSLVLIDLQRDFFDCRSGGIGRLEKAIGLPATRRLLTHAREHSWPIFHEVTAHSGVESLPVHLQRTNVHPYCLDGTEGAQIVSGLLQEGEGLIKKQGYSAFNGTALASLLEDTSSIVLAGIAADCCILTTAFDAASLGKHVYLPYQAIAASRLKEYVSGLVCVAKSAAIVADLQRLLFSDGPSLDHSLSSDQITAQVSDWFQMQLAVLERFRGDVPAWNQVPIDDALRLLESRLETFSES
jgi:nicotinamidase-related amidase